MRRRIASVSSSEAMRDDFGFYDGRIPVIVEKTVESDVLDIEKIMSVPAEMTFGHFVSILRQRANLGAHREIFVFVKNTLMIPNGASMWDIYEKHNDDHGILSLTYSGDDLFCSANTSFRLADSLMREDPSGASVLGELPDTWTPLLSTLEKLVSMAQSNEDLKNRLEKILISWRNAFCSLLFGLSKRDDIQWVTKVKDFANFDVRNRLLRTLFPEHELEGAVLILNVSRENLFQNSRTEVMKAQKPDFYGRISVEFENEEGRGDGVLREWFVFLCKLIFGPENKLFVPSPNDPRRFSPHPNLYQTDVQSYRFAGRIIALALKHRVQVGILLDPLFFLHLAGKTSFSLEDVKLSDTDLHKQFKYALDMDAQEFDAVLGDALQTTSANRSEYIRERVMDHCFHQIRDPCLAFSSGVQDIIEEENTAEMFFNLLTLDDLDSLLRGQQDDHINVDDWVRFTVYEGYTAEDKTIRLFWDVLHNLNRNSLHKVLHFWTSHWFLPINGFQGLPMRLSISRLHVKEGLEKEYKPQARTCFYSLQLPVYNTSADTQINIHYILQDYVFSGFGEH